MALAFRARRPAVDLGPDPEWISDPELPPPPSRRRLAALLALTVVVPLLWVIGTQLAGPDDGTFVDPHVNGSQWHTGIPINAVHGGTPLRAGDIVTAIGGRATTTLDSAHGPERHAGDVVRYDIVRDGQARHVDVKLFRFDVLAGFARTWLGFLLPTLALLIGLFVVLRRPREPAAHVSLWLGVLLLAGMTGWLLGLRAIDLGGGRGLVPQIGGELCRTLKWSAFLHLAIVFPHPPQSRAWRRWAPIAAYTLPLALVLGLHAGRRDPARPPAAADDDGHARRLVGRARDHRRLRPRLPSHARSDRPPPVRDHPARLGRGEQHLHPAGPAAGGGPRSPAGRLQVRGAVLRVHADGDGRRDPALSALRSAGDPAPLDRLRPAHGAVARGGDRRAGRRERALRSLADRRRARRRRRRAGLSPAARAAPAVGRRADLRRARRPLPGGLRARQPRGRRQPAGRAAAHRRDARHDAAARLRGDPAASPASARR